MLIPRRVIVSRSSCNNIMNKRMNVLSISIDIFNSVGVAQWLDDFPTVLLDRRVVLK